MDVIIKYLNIFVALGTVCTIFSICNFITLTIIARNTEEKKEASGKLADIRIAFCLGPASGRNTHKNEWFTTNKIYVVNGTRIVDDQDYEWCMYIPDKKPGIVTLSGYKFYVM